MRRGVLVAVLLVSLLAACETEPASDVTHDQATLNATLNARVPCEGTDSIEWWWEYGTTGFGEWNEAQHHTDNCAGDTSTVVRSERVTGLTADVEYRFRICGRLNGAPKDCYDSAGTKNGSVYDVFKTLRFPTLPTARAWAFSDSVGVVTHASYLDTVYGRQAELAAKMTELGVKHIREHAYKSTNADWNTTVWNAVNTYAGSSRKLTLGISMRTDSAPISELLQVIVDHHLSKTVGVEGPNEVDYYDPDNWPSRLPAHMQQLYSQVKNHPNATLRNVPVLGPSFGSAEGVGQAGDLSAYMDYGNYHPYSGCQTPSDAHLTYADNQSAEYAGNKEWLATEVGFHTAVNQPRSAGHPACSERVGGVYTLRTVLSHFRWGVPRSFVYELVDVRDNLARDDSEENFGLLRNDLSPKPAFTALKNLLATIGAGTPSSLEPLEGIVEDRPSDMQLYAFEQADGDYVLALWRHASIWDRANQQPITVTPRNVRLQLPSAASVSWVDPMANQAEQTLALSNQRVSLSLAGDPVLLVVR